MIIYKQHQNLLNNISVLKYQGKKITFVPTMGALHKGHISLLHNKSEANNIIVSSIFINPTQFNNSKDFEKYPINIEKDIYELEKSGTNILFLPSVEEIYPNGTELKYPYDLGYLETILEGLYRPGHFQGVCQVVERLIKIVDPDVLVLGQKDYQQCMVINKLVNIIGVPVKIIIGETIREKDGLAMSSRNVRLGDSDRKKAVLIYKTMLDIKHQIKQGSLKAIKTNAVKVLTTAGFTVDYVEIANAETLEIVDERNNNTRLVILIAAFINGVRLIDNLRV